MTAWIVTGFYVCGFIAAIDAVMKVRTSQGAVAWSISLVTFPFVAVPAYLVLGRSKFEGMVAAYEEKKDQIEGIREDILQGLKPWIYTSDDSKSIYNGIRNLSGKHRCI